MSWAEVSASEVFASEVFASEVFANKPISIEGSGTSDWVSWAEVSASGVSASGVSASEVSASGVSASEGSASGVSASGVSASEVSPNKPISIEGSETSRVSPSEVSPSEVSSSEVSPSKVCRSEKLCAWMNTAESQAWSCVSAIASLIVWEPGANPSASAVKTLVKPSYSISKNAPPSFRSLLLKNSELLALVPRGLPPLTVLMATGVVVPGIRAIFSPFRKKPNTSLYAEFVHSIYSSEAKT